MWNLHLRQATATSESRSTNFHNAAGKCQLHQATTVHECHAPYVRDTVGKHYLRQTATAGKRIVPDGRNALRDDEFRDMFAIQVEFVRLIQGIGTIAKLDLAPFRKVGNMDTFQSSTPLKRKLTNGCHTLWNRHALQFGAMTERILANGHHTFRNRHVLQLVTVSKRILTNGRHTFRDCHALQNEAARERTLANAHDRETAERGRHHHMPRRLR